ncbi:MAG: iron ABC transporter permease [Gammaproteobacteria bacterium]|nr:iron ABC transporter permease [Gammaproteobacteria bacterium]
MSEQSISTSGVQAAMATRTGVLRSARLARLFNLQTLVWLGITIVLLILVLMPMYQLVLKSLQDDSGWTLANYAQILEVERFHEATWNSLKLGLICAVLGMFMGAPLAWLVSRTNVPFRGLIRFCVLGAFVTPGFVNALSWILLAGPNAGLLNKTWRALTGASDPLINIFSMEGLVLVSLATVYPLAFLFMYNAFEMMDTEIEEAAQVSGAGKFRILWTITIPLAWPAIVAGFILMFLESLILYGVPAVIGVPSRVYVITTQLWSLFEYPPQIGLAAALSLPLLLVTLVLLWLQRKMVSRGSYATIKGKGGRRRRIDLGLWKWPALAFAFFIILFTFILPYFMICGTSLLAQSYRGFAFDNLTLHNFHYVLFTYEAGLLSIYNSMVTGLIAAGFGVVIGGVIAYLSERKIVPFGSWLAFLVTAPLVIPGMVFAVGLFAAYSSGPIVLYGTLTIIALAYLTKFMPFAYMSCASSIASIYHELESAARVLGASRLRVLKDITVPLMKSGLLAGFILIFVPSVKELSSSVLLYNSQTTVIATAIMDAYLLPSWEAVAALSVILLAINAVVILVGYRLLGGNILGQSN